MNPKGKGSEPVLSVRLSTDHMAAELIIREPEGSEEKKEAAKAPAVTAEKIRDALKQANVSFGVDEALVEKLGQTSAPGTYVVAHGKAPADGEDGRVICHFTTQRRLAPKALPDGRVDYHHLGLVQNVHRGDILCSTTPPTAGTPGKDVLGHPIAQHPGKPAELVPGDHTHVEAGGTLLISGMDGEISPSGERVNVYSTFTVSQDVDVSTGDVEFVGNIHVQGNVREGMHIDAGGSVEVDGIVDGGTIRAKGNIVIHQGCIGRGNTTFWCGGDFIGNFVQNCVIRADRNLTVASLMDCNVACDGTIRLVGTRARILGGEYRAGRGITAGSIGSATTSRTELTLDVDPSVLEKIAALRKELGGLDPQFRKLKNFRETLKTARGKILVQKMKDLPQQVESSLSDLEKKIAQATAQAEALEKKQREALAGTVDVKQTVYRGVRITIGPAAIRLENDCTEARFCLKSGKIVSESLPSADEKLEKKNES